MTREVVCQVNELDTSVPGRLDLCDRLVDVCVQVRLKSIERRYEAARELKIDQTETSDIHPSDDACGWRVRGEEGRVITHQKAGRGGHFLQHLLIDPEQAARHLRTGKK